MEIAGNVREPYEAWMRQVARNLTDAIEGFLIDHRYLIMDRAPVFTAGFRALPAGAGVESMRLPARSLDSNAYAERFVRSIRDECLSNVVPLGERHLWERVQTIPAIPEEKFEKVITETIEAEQELSTAAMYRAAKNVHVSNNSGNNEWYTPPEIVIKAREMLGDIELDAASSELANKTVQAERYFTAQDNGLQFDWVGKVWMNPPYAQPAIEQFTEKLVDEFIAGNITEALVLVNNATETGWFQYMLYSCAAVCFLKGRVKFIDMDGNPSGAPLQGQAILYFGDHTEAFISVFGNMGKVLCNVE